MTRTTSMFGAKNPAPADSNPSQARQTSVSSQDWISAGRYGLPVVVDLPRVGTTVEAQGNDIWLVADDGARVVLRDLVRLANNHSDTLPEFLFQDGTSSPGRLLLAETRPDNAENDPNKDPNAPPSAVEPAPVKPEEEPILSSHQFSPPQFDPQPLELNPLGHLDGLGDEDFKNFSEDEEHESLLPLPAGPIPNAPSNLFPDTAIVDEDGAVTVDVLANDISPDGDVLTVLGADDPAHGTVAIGTDGQIVYTPDPDYNGTDTFIYTVTDGNGSYETATVTITVNPVNDDPIAVDDAVTVNEDMQVAIDVLANDIDVDGDALTVTDAGGGAHGSVTIQTDGTILYTPDADYFGTDSFIYTLTDGQGGVTSSATVTVTVAGVNDAPFARDDGGFDTNEDTPATLTPIDLLGNDTDIDGDTLTVIGAGGGTNGTATVTTDGNVVFTPDANFHGEAAFVYTISDGNGGTASASVTFQVASVNDDPVAYGNIIETDEDTAATLNVITDESFSFEVDEDVDGDTLTLIGVSDPAHGTVSFGSDGQVVYTPDPDYFGTDDFTYTITDGNGGATASAIVSVFLVGVNDAPVANEDFLVAVEDTPLTVSATVLTGNDTDVDGIGFTLFAVSDAVNGTVSLNGSNVIFTPDADYNGTASYSYTITDGNGGTASTTVFVTVTGVNDPPVAQPDTVTILEDTPTTLSSLTLNDSDIDGDTLTIVGAHGPNSGTVTVVGGDVVYTPNPEFNGTDSFAYTITDGNGGSHTAQVTVTVQGVNDAPIAVDDHFSLTEDGAIGFSPAVFLGNDTDVEGDTLTLIGVGTASHGTVTFATNGTYEYRPDPDFHGTDSFDYTITDGNGGTATALMVITVTPVNDAPEAVSDYATTDEDTPVTITVLANDSDVDGDSLTVTSASGGGGSVTVGPGGTIIYTPVPDYSGTDLLAYTITDGVGGTASAFVVISINSVNDIPVALDDTATIDEDTAATISVLSNDSDGENDPLTVMDAGDGAFGTTTVTTFGTVVYTPNPDFFGTDSFIYTVTDGVNGTATAQVTVTVNGINDAPIADDDTYSVAENTVLTIGAGTGVLDGDTDADPDTLSVSLDKDPSHGTISLGTDGSFVYTPDALFNGTDNFTYVVTDGNGGTDSASVTVTVVGPDDPVTASDDSATTNEDTSVTANWAGNDSIIDGVAAVTVGTGPLHGTVVMSTNGSYVYTPDEHYSGTDSFTYVVTDGSGGTTASASVALSITAVADAPLLAAAAGDSACDSFMVNTTTPDIQVGIRLGALTGGGFVAVWGNRNGPGDNDIHAQRYFDDGTPNGGEFLVNSTTVQFHNAADVVGLDDGGFIVAWQTQGQDDTPFDYGVYLQRYDASGMAVGGETLVNTTTSGDQGFPQVATLGGGGYVVTWVSQDSSSNDIYGQRYKSDGSPDGGEFLINTTTADNQIFQSVASLTDGGFVVTWQSDDGSNNEDVYLQRYNADGTPNGGEVLVNTTTTFLQGYASVAGLEDGGYVVTWMSPQQDGTFYDIYAQRYDASGAPVGGEFLVNTSTTLAATYPSVVGLDDGGFLISYTWEGTFGSSADILAQRYFADGTPNGPEFLVNTCEQEDLQSSSDMIALSGGRAVVGWNQILNGEWDVFGRIIDSTPEDAPIPLTIDVQLVDTDGSESLEPVTISGVMAGASFNAGTDMGGGVWVIDLVDLPGLEITPPQDYFGPLTITISATSTEASNGDDATTTIVRTFFIDPVNDAPIADDDNVATDKNVPITLTNATLIANDTDVDGGPLTVIGAGNGTFGTTSVATNGTVVYTPNPGFDGTDSFTYTITDGAGGTSSATVIVTVTDTNVAPIAVDDSATTLDDVAVTIPVLTNDTDGDGDLLTVISAGDPPNGTISIVGGNVIYTPDPGYTGTDSFIYTIDDANGGIATASVLITVNNGFSPIAGEGWYGMMRNSTLNSSAPNGVLFNEYDADGDPMTVLGATAPLHGTLTMNTDGSFVYQPTSGFEGTDFYTYSITDGNHGLTDAATIHIHVGTRTVGNGSPNVIAGTAGVDDIDAFGGDDTVNAGDGADFINGNSGADTLNGDGGDDYINGNNSSPTTTDILNGGTGNDVLYGNIHADTMTGGDGHDRFKFYMSTGMPEFNVNNVITDFTPGATSGGSEVPNADILDLRDVLLDYNGVPSQYITLQVVGADTRVNIDANGPSGGSSYSTLVVLQGVTGLDLNTLIGDGNILLPDQNPH